MTNETRAAFEAWYLDRYPHMDFSRNMPDGSYNSPALYGAWPVWEAAYLASRRAALEEAAKVCEEMRDLKEAQKAQKNADAAIESGDESEMLHRLRHCSNVSLFNGALERAARGIRALADEGMKPC